LFVHASNRPVAANLAATPAKSANTEVNGGNQFVDRFLSLNRGLEKKVPVRLLDIAIEIGRSATASGGHLRQVRRHRRLARSAFAASYRNSHSFLDTPVKDNA
jgi:hypothetical protein